ncbi:uncharacterized protein LY79DRAFT_139433 [Colletotrichum navitas]|uniref:Uncharacterized protein n=1 Tax=Colletotrichum navitas TaxID=681940 RepID=A0AAD8VAP3_9PEZI|nr:uncharacterized protein LY79DRAFT_139433 [Colletotrichum navitas]KAK1599389.1 hypothetical protein LY79DRAFT_139433 [Colletotrichum navitas]
MLNIMANWGGVAYMALGLCAFRFLSSKLRLRRERVTNSGFLPPAFLRPAHNDDSLAALLYDMSYLSHHRRQNHVRSLAVESVDQTDRVRKGRAPHNIATASQMWDEGPVFGVREMDLFAFVVLDTILLDQRLPVAIRPRTSSNHDVFSQESAASLLARHAMPSGCLE